MNNNENKSQSNSQSNSFESAKKDVLNSNYKYYDDEDKNYQDKKYFDFFYKVEKNKFIKDIEEGVSTDIFTPISKTLDEYHHNNFNKNHNNHQDDEKRKLKFSFKPCIYRFPNKARPKNSLY